MLEFFDPNFIAEEEVIIKLQNSFMNKYSLDHFSASDLALEVMELLSLTDSNISALNKYYLT